MASELSPKGSKPQHFCQAIRRGYDRFKLAMRPSAHILFRHSGNPATPTGANPALAAVNVEILEHPEHLAAGALRDTEAAAWARLEMSLRGLEQNADAFPLLKSAINELIACLNILWAAVTNDERYEMLVLELAKLTGTLNEHISKLSSGELSGSVADIARCIEAEVTHISRQQDHLKGEQTGGFAQDKEDVVKHYRQIEGLFRQLQSDIDIQILMNINQQHAERLRRMPYADDARYNSNFSVTTGRHGCMAETREKVQADLQDWVQDPNAAKVYWMNGMAGTGKTTIAYSLCDRLEANQWLGASFFCSRVSPSCRDVNRIVPTIAYQLARYSPPYQLALCNILEGDPDASNMDVVRQFEKLIRKPLEMAKDSIPANIIIVIDALDECEDAHGVGLMLETLLRLAVDLPLKFFVTSRPEPVIRDNILLLDRYLAAVLHSHDIGESIVEEDIKRYLTEALRSMSPAPSDEQIKQLAKRAGRLFIYAVTVVRYILSIKRSAKPIARLSAILATDLQSTNEEKSSQEKQLDELYTAILAAEELTQETIQATRLVLMTAVCAKEPMSTTTIASLHGLTEERVSLALHPLRSVLHVSEAGGIVSTLHASFPDFMLSRFRSGSFYCDEAHHSELLANRCFDVMKDQLRFNICDLRSSFVFDKDVPDLGQRIKANISSSLLYACRYWGEHLMRAGISDTLHNELADFLAHRLLFWMEVLNLKQCLRNGVSTLARAEKWLSNVNTSADTQKLAADARDFVTRFATNPCTLSTPHIYISALPFCATSSTVYGQYWRDTRGLIDVKGTAINPRNTVVDSQVFPVGFSPDGTRIASGSLDGTIRVWDLCTHDDIAGPFEGHTDAVISVAFSPNGTRIVSGSEDRTICIWDVRSGQKILNPLRGHTSSIKTAAFSPDGTRIVSGSEDCTIRIWEVQSGQLVQGPLQGHTDWVNSAAFSPDGARIVSGSRDCTIRVWDVQSGQLVLEPLQGHTGWVNSAAFSPDGARIVSGSHDKTIRTWDARSGKTALGPLKEHTEPVRSVAFSLDGTRIVSGSDDKTISMWNAESGKKVLGPLKGHTNSVRLVAFSSDGTRIVSGSYDKTIRLWDAHTGDAITGSLKRHVSWVNSVAFSPDGAHIVSGSSDRTVRLWDAHTGEAVAGPFQGHTYSVNSVVFSPDGSRIVSGSSDQTIRVWNVRNSGIIAEPFKGHTGWVNSVAFSPDGTRIVSGSSDRTIRVWNVRNGNIAAGPFEGHTGWVNSVVFSPDGSRIVSGSDDRTLLVWDAHTGNLITGPFEGHTGSIRSIAFSPDGTRIASGSSDRTIRVWDSRTGNPIARPLEGHTLWVKSVAFSPDGMRIVSSSFDCTLRMWDARTGDGIAGPFKGHTNSVNSVAFSPDGTRVVSGSDDETIRVWGPLISDAMASAYMDHENAAPGFYDQNFFLPDIAVSPAQNPTQQDPMRSDSLVNRYFELNKDGWATTNGVPLFWIPPELRAIVPYPHHVLVIGPQGSIYISYRHLTLGERWTECYIPQ